MLPQEDPAPAAPPEATPIAPLVPRGGTLGAVLVTMRPHQWVKNLFVVAPVIFSKNLLRPSLLGKAVLAFVLFSMFSSAVYLINDLADVEKDRQHPRKRNRPIASGRLAPK